MSVAAQNWRSASTACGLAAIRPDPIVGISPRGYRSTRPRAGHGVAWEALPLVLLVRSMLIAVSVHSMDS